MINKSEQDIAKAIEYCSKEMDRLVLSDETEFDDNASKTFDNLNNISECMTEFKLIKEKELIELSGQRNNSHSIANVRFGYSKDKAEFIFSCDLCGCILQNDIYPFRLLTCPKCNAHIKLRQPEEVDAICKQLKFCAGEDV